MWIQCNDQGLGKGWTGEFTTVHVQKMEMEHSEMRWLQRNEMKCECPESNNQVTAIQKQELADQFRYQKQKYNMAACHTVVKHDSSKHGNSK